jgi:flagellar hook-associated protein 3 FlgL
MVAELGVAGLGAEAREAVLAKATQTIGDALTDLTAIQTRLGTAQGRVEAANGRMRQEQDVLERRLAALEGADPIEAKVRIDTLSTQIEMSYSLTSRLLRLSIMNYA